MASPIGSGSAISPTHDVGTSDRPSSSSGSWNRARPRIALVSAPSAAQRVRERATGSPARPNPTTASTSHTTMHGTTTASWIRGHVPNHSSVDGVVTRVTASASPYPPSATRYGSQTTRGRRRTIPIGAGKTRPRWTAAGHMSMYTPAVRTPHGARTGRPGRGRSSSPRGTTARCCPPPRTRRARARSRRARPGGARTRAPRRPPSRSRTGRCSSPRAAPPTAPGTAHVTDASTAAPSRVQQVGQGTAAGGPGDATVQHGPGPRVHRPPVDRVDPVTGLQARLRLVDRADDDAGGGPGVLVERDPATVRRHRQAQDDEQRPPRRATRRAGPTSRAAERRIPSTAPRTCDARPDAGLGQQSRVVGKLPAGRNERSGAEACL